MPERFATVEEFVDAQPPARRAAVEALRDLVREAEPALVEGVKWNSPNYTLDGVDRLTINAAGKGPVRLILHFGTQRVEDKSAAPSFDGDPTGLLTWHSDIRASLTMPTDTASSGDGFAGQRDQTMAVVRRWLEAP